MAHCIVVECMRSTYLPVSADIYVVPPKLPKYPESQTYLPSFNVHLKVFQITSSWVLTKWINYSMVET